MDRAKDALGLRFGEEIESHHEIFGDPELIRLLGRKTCREYNSAPLPSDLVDALLRVAFSASSKSDYQQASVIKVEDPTDRLGETSTIDAVGRPLPRVSGVLC
jgi:FMN reductase [NAD(P)H]